MKRDRLVSCGNFVCWCFCLMGIVKQCGRIVCFEYKVGCYLLLAILFVLHPAERLPTETGRTLSTVITV
jgi:hypothetical protein